MRAVLKDRGLGMLIGVHCGDSLGATLEFAQPSAHPMAHKDILGEGPFNWKPGDATDDTDLMIAVLEALVNVRKFDFEALKANLIAWADKSPKDIGQTTEKGIENLRKGMPFRECGYKHPTMFGNGSIMRVAPLALYQGEDLKHVLTTQCLMTHGHDLCVQTDIQYVNLLQSLLHSYSIEKTFAEFKERISKEPLISTILKEALENPWEKLNTSGHAVWTLGAGVWALNQVVTGKLTPEDALIYVVNRGDDSDTCASVAGAILGAAYGVSVWPARWVDVLEKKSEIQKNLNRLLD